jgi:hypothetical protein
MTENNLPPHETWQTPAVVAPPRIKQNVSKNLEETKYVGKLFNTFLESLEATLKGVFRQDPK